MHISIYIYIVIYMNTMIYINSTNSPSFSAEENKSGLVNKLLEEYYGSTRTYPVGTTKVPGGQVVVPKVVEKLPPRPQVDILGVTKGFVPKAPDPTKGYPCCVSTTKLCKHWIWDGNTQSRTNSITGEVREAPAW